MKIVIFEPHPDDLFIGPGPILLDWINEGNHDIHIITVTDGMACYRSRDDNLTIEDSKDKQFQYTIDEERGALLSEWLNIYQSQAMMKWMWKMHTRYIKKIRTWTYARYRFNDIGKYYNI